VTSTPFSVVVEQSEGRGTTTADWTKMKREHRASKDRRAAISVVIQVSVQQDEAGANPSGTQPFMYLWVLCSLKRIHPGCTCKSFFSWTIGPDETSLVRLLRGYGAFLLRSVLDCSMRRSATV
jgi:hypothetical protein